MIDTLKTDALELLLTEPIYILRHEITEAPAVNAEPMPAENSKLPPHNSIPEIPKTPAITTPKLPRNRNQVVIIYNNQQTVYLNPEEEVLLTKIMGAVKLRLEDVELVNINNHRDTLVDILKDKLVNQILSFGIELRDLDIQIPMEPYRVIRVEGIDMLLADSLFELQLNTDKKKMLWQALQGMFLLSQRR